MVGIYNRLVMLRNNVDKAFGNIDVLLKQRADEIPNLIKVVKESMNYESGMMTKLTEMRSAYLAATAQILRYRRKPLLQITEAEKQYDGVVF